MNLNEDSFVDITLQNIFSDPKIPAFQKSQEILSKVLRGELSPAMAKTLLEFTETVFTQHELDEVMNLLDDSRLVNRVKTPLRAVK